MQILIRAIITGFGLKLGSDLYRVINRRLGVFPDDEDVRGKSRDDDEDGEIEASKPVALGLIGLGD
ncbi:MAG TPA: hypothetical protein PKW35_14270 [Nannocystaceae bacterium]|nr:hypothetical protein [Nannocystaceae bacterium]